MLYNHKNFFALALNKPPFAVLDKNKANKKFWEIKASGNDADTGEIYIYGDIVSYKWDDADVTAADFAKDLNALGDIKTLNIYINSYGGSVFQGQAVYSILKRHSAEKNVYVDGIAASIASLIAMAGDNIYMPENAMMMIHNPWGFAMGNAQEMRQMADSLDKIRKAMIPAYLNKTGEKLTEDKLVELLDAESWLTAQECYDYGLCDKLLEEKKIAASVSTEMLEKYKNVPDALKGQNLDGAADKLSEEERAAMLRESKTNLERLNTIMEDIYNANQSL